MNKATQLLFLVLFPFLPFLAWLLSIVRNTPIEMVITLILIPIVFFIIISPQINFPKYLIFFALFTVYHLSTVYINDLVPKDTNLIKFILADENVVACLLFLVVENTSFDERFIKIMNRNIFIVVIISLLVSLIQLKNPTFFIPSYISENISNETFLTENRIFSIYTWLDVNTLGITFPVLISIMINFVSTKTFASKVLILSGLIVSFLSKARYVMVSAIIVFSQLFFSSKINISKKVYILLIFFASIMVSLGIANALGYNIKQVVDERILEKGSNMGSANTRILSFYVFLKVFPENPLFGVGPATQSNVIRLLGGSAPIIHIGYLSYLYYYGLFGCFFLFMGLFLLLKNAWIVGSKYKFWGGFYGLLAFCVANLTMVYFNISEMGIILIVIYLRYFTETASMELIEVE